MATSNAPAGQVYRNIEHAGQCTLQTYAESFPETDKSLMIPPKFVAKYPEPVDENTGEIVKTNRTLTKKEENRFTGLTRNASGEEAEYKVFKAFEKQIQLENDPPILIIRNYVLQNFRANVLAAETGIDFSDIHTVAEFDAVVAVKDTGLILVEVKRRFTEEQQAKAEEQVKNGKLFFERIMSRITGSACRLPVLKIIIFPCEPSASPTTKSDRDTHIVNQDLLVNFNRKWDELTCELNMLKSTSKFNSEDFQRFVYIISGVWCMEKYQKHFYKFNNEEASSNHQLQQNDQMIQRTILTSDVRTAKNELKITQPVTNVELCRPQDGFPTCAGIDLIYLTPEQKNLYQNVPQAIIRAAAGSGKTLISYLKIVEILENHSNKNILIIAPDPHHLRMEQFVRSNGVEPTVSETFPPSTSGGVVIMTSENFFDVFGEALWSYDVSMYHVLIDDLQSIDLPYSSWRCAQLALFIDRCYNNVIGTDQIFWCAVDEGQSKFIHKSDGEDQNITSLFYIDDDETTPREFTIPIYNLDKTLRNSVEISTVAKKVCEMRVGAQVFRCSRVHPHNPAGHHIRSEAVLYQKLTKWTSTGNRYEDQEKHGYDFAVERVKEELMSLLKAQQHTKKLNDIAVLTESYTDAVVEPLRKMLLTTFNITPQTIKEYIITNNNTIVLDSTNSSSSDSETLFTVNLASFECACVLYLCGDTAPGSSDHYNVMTRARTKLVVIDFDIYEPHYEPLLTEDVIFIQWEEKDGVYHKL